MKKYHKKHDNVHDIRNNYVLNIYNDENECINDMLSKPKKLAYHLSVSRDVEGDDQIGASFYAFLLLLLLFLHFDFTLIFIIGEFSKTKPKTKRKKKTKFI